MEGNIIGFAIWCIIGILFLGLSISAWFSKKPVGFWANVKRPKVSDVKKYNHAVSKLLFVFSIVYLILGIPLLAGQNSAWIILSILGVMAESIAAMAVYSLVIEKKYKL